MLSPMAPSSHQLSSPEVCHDSADLLHQLLLPKFSLNLGQAPWGWGPSLGITTITSGFPGVFCPLNPKGALSFGTPNVFA